MEIELKNYRAFGDQSPARWMLKDGFTALVGVNNSGKSSLLRFFHEIRPVLDYLKEQSGFANFLAAGESTVTFQSVADNSEVFHNGNDRPMVATFALEDATDEEPSAVKLTWRRDLILTTQLEWRGATATIRNLNDWPMVEVEANSYLPRLNLTRYQQEFGDFWNSLYLGPFRNAVNVGGTSSYYDLQIGEQFIAEWDGIKTGSDKARNRAAVAVQHQLRQIFDLDGLEINAAPGNSTLQVIVNDEPYQLQEQGSGFAQFVVVLAFVATRKPAYVFIDEPELNLHPSLQIDFLTTLAGYSGRGVAFATHSLGLARSLGQRIYSVRRGPGDGRSVRDLPATRDYVEFLGELGLTGYSELGFERILLVEGPTEVPAIQAWLRLYGLEHKIVLVPLGGGSLINATSGQMLNEISRITTNVSVLIDSERSSAGADLDVTRATFVENCESLGFDVHVLERRALENYLPDDAVKKAKGDKYSGLGEYKRLDSAQPTWGKNENWQIAAKMTRDDLAGTDLEVFFSTLAKSVAA